MKTKFCFWALAILFFATYINSLSQTAVYNDENSSDIVRKDTICYKIKFRQGDTIYYRVEAADSIAINYGEPLHKTRFELWRIVCDSVSKSGLFYLSQSLINFVSRESSGDIKDVERNTSPWTGRKATFAIDSIGKRYFYGVDDSTLGALSPGGAFHPYLFYYFGESCKEINESWMAKDSLAVPENGVPIPRLRNTFLFRAQDTLDTLGYSCNRFEYINTGRGVITLNTDKAQMSIASIFNGHGVYTFSREWDIPVHYFATLEVKMDIYGKDDRKEPGWHYINVLYTLDRFIPGNTGISKTPIKK